MRIRILVRLCRHSWIFTWKICFMLVIGHKNTQLDIKAFPKAWIRAHLLILVNFLVPVSNLYSQYDPDPDPEEPNDCGSTTLLNVEYIKSLALLMNWNLPYLRGSPRFQPRREPAAQPSDSVESWWKNVIFQNFVNFLGGGEFRV